MDQRATDHAAEKRQWPVPRPDGPQAFRWALAGGSLPRIEEALRVGEAARATVYKAAGALGLLPLPVWFHGSRDRFHSHAFWLPEDADADGRIDHVLLFVERGLPEALIPVLAAGGPMWLAGGGAWRLTADWMGRRAPGALFGPAVQWSTVTAYVQPQWGSGSGQPQLGDHIARHIAFEGACRGLPPPVRIAVFGEIASAGTAIPASRFTRATSKRRAFSRASAAGVAIRFAAPVWGPLALGFGAHFGLGLFEPADHPGKESWT